MARTSYPKQLNNIKNTMNPQDLKKGQSYLILANYDGKDCDNDYVFTAVPAERRLFLNLYAVQTCVSLPSEPPTLVGSPNLYRRFRKGDRVRVVAWQGRSPFDTHHGLKINAGEIHIVLDDEYERNEVYIGMSSADEEQSVIHACHLELVTPVEELERYVLIHNAREKYYDVCWKDDDEPDGRTGRTRVRATFWYHKPPQTYSQTEALSAAETERDRLNAEHRKEQA